MSALEALQARALAVGLELTANRDGSGFLYATDWRDESCVQRLPTPEDAEGLIAERELAREVSRRDDWVHQPDAVPFSAC